MDDKAGAGAKCPAGCIQPSVSVKTMLSNYSISLIQSVLLIQRL